ncbi:ribosome silencing factor [Bartonella sp. HY328]|uniref:ribosome silencing factor n=1 Tax=unclassified Bartonella TaxID=2645622 RepID=UPI003965A0DC
MASNRPGRKPHKAIPLPELQLEFIIECLEDAKAEDIIQIDIRGKSALGDFMVIASGRSSRHVASAGDQILRKLREEGVRNVKVEGLPDGDWVLIDTGDVIIHLFRPEVREFYNLEKMWQQPDNDKK